MPGCRDVGLHPGSSVTGFDSVTMAGELHIADAVAEQAKTDLVTAYTDAAGRQPVTTTATELGGQTLAPGVYTSASGTFGMTGTLTLDAAGDGNAVFIFTMPTTLVTATDSRVNLINGADACNVYWQVGSSATLGTRTSFKGNILALTSISLNTGAVIDGRAMARNGAVTMDTNTITRAACTPLATPTPTPTLTPTPTPTPTATPVPTPTVSIPVSGSPTVDTPTGGTPTVATPTGDTPTVGTPTGDTPTSGTPTVGTPTGGTPTVGTPTGGTPTGGTPPTRTTPPTGGVPAGGGSTAGGHHIVLLGLGYGLLLSAGAVVIARPRRPGQRPPT
ncbi:MAG: ice-binding family protein [Egibacteraceae bacterium]